MPKFNPYEFQAREIKKHAIIQYIYMRFFRPTTVKARRAMASTLKNATKQEREWFARSAKVNPPTDETWRQIVEEVKRG